MATITTGSHPKLLWPGVEEVWGRTYNQHPEECLDLFDRETSDKSRVELVEATGFGMASNKPESDGVYYDSEEQGTVTTAVHLAYALGYKVSKEEQDDNLYSEVSERRAAALAFSMKTTRETVCANMYNRGFDSNYTFGDGKEMLATNHPTKSGNQSNELSTASDLTEAAIEDLIIDIGLAKNSRGLQIALRPRCLIVPQNLYFKAERILKSTLQNDTGNNAINVIRNAGLLPEGLKVNHYLTDADAWFIRTDIPAAGLKLYDRVPVMFDQDNDFDTMNLKAKAYMRFSVTIGDFRAIYGSPGV